MSTALMQGVLHLTVVSAGPKVAAIVDFVCTTGAIFLIGQVEDLATMMKGDAGTRVGIQRP